MSPANPEAIDAVMSMIGIAMTVVNTIVSVIGIVVTVKSLKNEHQKSNRSDQS